MSTFNVHEWNRKRRLAALNEAKLKEGAFGDNRKAALENKLTGLAKDIVIDGSLFAEYGNVTYDEANLKDGATPEEIEAIDQIKAAVIEMGGRVNYGVSDEDGTLTYMYLVVDEPPTYDAVLKVITKENNEPNLFRSVFKEEQVGEKIYLVMVGRSYQTMGPVKAFTDKASAEKHADERKQEYEDRLDTMDTLATQVIAIPLG